MECPGLEGLDRSMTYSTFVFLPSLIMKIFKHTKKLKEFDSAFGLTKITLATVLPVV